MQFAFGILTHTPPWVFALLAYLVRCSRGRPRSGAVAVIAAVDPDGRTAAAVTGRAISGATAGYFIGSTIALLREYFRKRAMDAGS